MRSEPTGKEIEQLMALYSTGMFNEAGSLANRLLQDFPDSPILLHVAGSVEVAKGNIGTALELLKKAATINPIDPTIYNSIGNAFTELGNSAEAITNYREALRLAPSFHEALINLGQALKDTGEIKAALHCYGKALAEKPGFYETHRLISELTTYSESDAHSHSHLQEMRQLYSRGEGSSEMRSALCFALGKAYEDLGVFEQSFAFYREGNNLQVELHRYEPQQDKLLFENLKNTFASIRQYEQKCGQPGTAIKPVFIVGMLRSGTSLVEQIIASHSEVSAAGELGYVERFGHLLATGTSVASEEKLTEFRAQYLHALQQRSGGLKVITDKMPTNFRYIGLILSAIPEAKIIHVQREPSAVCWSNFKHCFTSPGLAYSNSLDDIVTYYNLYKKMMDFWLSKYNGRILGISYEDLTLNPKQGTERLLDYLGLGWEDSCLAPHKNARSVRTASGLQVRKEIYKGSSDRWRLFKFYIGEAFDKLVPDNN